MGVGLVGGGSGTPELLRPSRVEDISLEMYTAQYITTITANGGGAPASCPRPEEPWCEPLHASPPSPCSSRADVPSSHLASPPVAAPQLGLIASSLSDRDIRSVICQLTSAAP